MEHYLHNHCSFSWKKVHVSALFVHKTSIARSVNLKYSSSQVHHKVVDH